jgi:hypothetical protein
MHEQQHKAKLLYHEACAAPTAEQLTTVTQGSAFSRFKQLSH